MRNNIVLGTSFSPEYAKSLGCDKPLELLEIINKELGIKDIRLGLRWNVVEKDKKISLDYYDKYLKYLFKNDCKVCLNIGPIKVFRWPEEHIPKGISIKKREYITLDMDIAKYSYEYLEKLLILLKKEYGKKLDNAMFQIENECFYRFGRLGLLMSQEYILGLLKILKRYFPNNRVMFDSAGRKNLKEIVHLFKNINDAKIYPYESLVLGFNYYFKLPKRPQRDPLKGLSFSSMSITKLHHYQKKLGFELEISEGQFEPWGKVVSPGNSYLDYEYLINKSIRYFPKEYQYKLIRLWGSERLALKILNRKVNEEHEKIIASISHLGVIPSTT